MALKSNFEDANFISSPFVDEIANTGHVSEERAAAQRKAGEPFLSQEQKAIIARIDAQVAAAKKPKKTGLFESLRKRKKTIDKLSER